MSLFLTNSGASLVLANGGVPTGKALLTSNDLTYQGLWRATTASGATDANLGLSAGTLAIRYVGGSMRLLYHARYPNAGYPALEGTQIEGSWDWWPGPLLEFSVPETFGTTMSNAPELTLVRQWSQWVPGWYYTGNGSNVGGMWYDDDLDVLWTVSYDTYAGVLDKGWLAAVRLNDNGTVTKYGPWRHPLGAADGGNQRYRMAGWWIQEAPPAVKAANPNAEIICGACVGSTAAEGNYGPGMYWFKKPTLVETAAGVTYTQGTNEVNTPLLRIPNDSNNWGPLQGYSSAFTQPSYYCHRPPDYSLIDLSDEGQGLKQPVGDTGYWIASNDNIAFSKWIEGPSKQGILALGRFVAPGRWVKYTNTNPYTHPGDNQEYYSNVIGTGNGYKPFVKYPDQYTSTSNSPSMQAAGMTFNPKEAIEVMRTHRGEVGYSRTPADVQYQEYFDWNTKWPTIPIHAPSTGQGVYPDYPIGGTYEVYYCPQGNNCWATYDPLTHRIIWVLPTLSYYYGLGGIPLFAVLDVDC